MWIGKIKVFIVHLIKVVHTHCYLVKEAKNRFIRRIVRYNASTVPIATIQQKISPLLIDSEQIEFRKGQSLPEIQKLLARKVL
ncbi:hypothetical protein GCM10025879_03340 [Leuconostoc litchii]|nr:hypothetical protein GCM10025879_03340 [Leuconostoc litchii]